MKRIEMVHKIEQYMLQHEGGVKINIPRLLDVLEREGMSPPRYDKWVKAKDLEGIIAPTPEPTLFYKIPCHEWEPYEAQ